MTTGAHSNTKNSAIDWSAAKSEEVPWNDGHVPENLVDSDEQQHLRLYPEYHCNRGAAVHCIDNAAEAELANAVYKFSQKQTTWGSYVTMDQIREHWKKQKHTETTSRSCFENLSQDDLALQAAAAFIWNALNTNESSVVYQSGATTSSTDDDDDDQQRIDQALWTQQDCTTAHGVAVWALASTTGSQVPYHLDYAELLRYETGVIVPPVLAGTWQVTNAIAMQGGCYCVHPDGLEHYQRHGYKGVMKAIDMDNEHDDSWIRIPYKYNRMICQSGHLPHLSTKVESILAGENDCRRVIVGFNVFLKDVGAEIQQAPEHSDAFRRQVRRQSNNNKHKKLVLSQVLANPKLSKLLVLAKREKIKQDFFKAQEQLDRRIQCFLESQDDSVSVQQLLDFLSSSSSITDDTALWPRNVNDLHVHIHHRWKQGFLNIEASEECGKSPPTKLVDASWLVRLPGG